MEMVAKIVTEAFLMVLAVLSAPDVLTEFRIDAVSANGYMDTMIVRRINDGYELYDEMNNDLIKYMTIKVSKEKPGEYIVITHKGDKTESINPGKSIQKFNIKKLRTSVRQTLVATDDSRIKLNRSGCLAYLTSGQKMTFVIHCYNQNKQMQIDAAARRD